jgi:hypothetical protein
MQINGNIAYRISTEFVEKNSNLWLLACSGYSSYMEMETALCPGMSVHFYHTVQRYVLEGIAL